MKTIKSLTAVVAALAVLVSVSFAADQPSSGDKAKGKDAPACCKQAAKDGKTCDKCSKKKENKETK